MDVAFAPADEDTLYALFAPLRARELGMDGWDQPVRTTILRQQFDAQRGAYHRRYPNAREFLILADGTPAGWAVLDCAEPVWRLLDIGVANEWQRRGIATSAIRRWQDEARVARCAIALSVLRDNVAALTLYDRLGFRLIGQNDTRCEMEWQG